MVRTRRSSFAVTASRGVSLIFALLALVMLSLAAVALVRSVDTGTLVLGNLGFKQDAITSSDQAAEQAIKWIDGRAAAVLNDDSTDNAYWATSHDQLDPTSGNAANTARVVINWQGMPCTSLASGSYAQCLTPTSGTEVNGNKTQYAIFRLCPTTGAPNAAGNDCARPIDGRKEAGSINRGEFNYRKYRRFTSTPGGSDTAVYYRIIVRTEGGKNAVSFTETIVHK